MVILRLDLKDDSTDQKTIAFLDIHQRVAFPPNDQLTDGGPSVTPEFPSDVAGPPFGEALGSTIITFCNS